MSVLCRTSLEAQVPSFPTILLHPKSLGLILILVVYSID